MCFALDPGLELDGDSEACRDLSLGSSTLEPLPSTKEIDVLPSGPPAPTVTLPLFAMTGFFNFP